MKIHKAKTIEEAIYDLLDFLEADLWYAIENKEIKSEVELNEYLENQFKILIAEVERIQKSKSRKKGGRL